MIIRTSMPAETGSAYESPDPDAILPTDDEFDWD